MLVLAGIVVTRVPTEAAVQIEVLRQRYTRAGLEALAPHPRTYNDALRVAKLKPSMNGSMSMEQRALVDRLVSMADHTKIRTCLIELCQRVPHLQLDYMGQTLIRAQDIKYIRDVVRPLFQDLDKGLAGVSVVEIANTDSARQELSQDIARTIGGELELLMAKAHQALRVPEQAGRSEVMMWLQRIDLLRASMGLIEGLTVRPKVQWLELGMLVARLQALVTDRPKRRKI